LDGGKTWTVLDKNCPLPLGSQIQFLDSMLGYATMPGQGALDFFARYDARLSQALGYLYWTQDGGLSWEILKPALQ
jgi:photosystem II stability/assembly factor-like uncharacterized protein